MNREEIRNYIEKHKGEYSREAITKALVEHGASRTVVNTVYNNVEKGKSSGMSTGMIILIVVLCVLVVPVFIIGSLIFSFVDFGTMLPNKIDLTNNIRASATDSFAFSNDYNSGVGGENNEVWIVFTYTGAKQAKIAGDSGKIDTVLGEECFSYSVNNLDTAAEAGCSSDSEYCETLNESVSFLNSQSGILKFTCDNSEFGGKTFSIIQGDVVEGNIVIDVANAKTDLKVPSKGPFRLTAMS